MPTTLSRPPKVHHSFRRAAILFAGGPAPAANAVISTAAVSFLRNDIEVVGVMYGYSNLVQFGPDHPMQEGRDYVILDHTRLKRTRNSQGIMIGSARTNPGKMVTCKADLDDPIKTAPLKTTYDALCSLNVDALVSIGGDDTLKTANKFQMFQDRMPAGSHKIPVVHVPKTIDNDYMGIDFTFGYFTAVETLAGRSPQSVGRRRVDKELLPGRDDGPQCRLDRLRRRHCRRSQSGDQRRGHYRQVPCGRGSR